MVGTLVSIIITIIVILLVLWVYKSSSAYTDSSRINTESFTQYKRTNHEDAASPVNAGGFAGILASPLVYGQASLPSLGAIDSQGPHEERIPSRMMTVDKDEYKRSVGQNESITNPVRVYQKFEPRFKNPPMKTYGNIRMLGYRPGKKELHEYWCSKEKVYAQS